MEQSITAMMVRDHERIRELFNEFKKGKNKDLRKAKEIFERLDRELRNHFLAEEKVMKKAFGKDQVNEMVMMANDLRAEHGIMRDILDNINTLIKENKKISTAEMHSLLKKHEYMEEKIFYPELDEVLTKKERIKIFDRIGGKK